MRGTVAPSGAAAHARDHVEHCMGTAFSFHIAAPGVEDAALRAVVAWLHDMDALFSTYRPASQISLLDAGRLRPTDAAPVVGFVLAECERFRELTDGYFDARATGRLDPSGYVKGWAVQTASDRLLDAGSTNHYVNGGGDVALVGCPRPDRPWSVGITDPRRAGSLVRTVRGRGPLGIATSGLAERGSHLVDPHTGRPATGLQAVTVAATSLITADVYATAAAAMGADRGLAWLAGRADVHLATAVTAAGEIVDVGPTDPTAARPGPSRRPLSDAPATGR